MKGSIVMLKILVIVGSTRPNRKSKSVADWVVTEASADTRFDFEVIDLADLALPFFDEPLPPMADKYQHEHTKQWAKKVAAADGFILVTPEYNHSYPAVLKNALDFLHKEWVRKPVAFVSYGVMNGVRAVEHLKQVVVQLNMAPLNATVNFSVMQHWDEQGEFQPGEHAGHSLEHMLGELSWWGDTLKAGREKA